MNERAQIYSDQVVAAIILDNNIREEKLYIDAVTGIQLEAASKMESAHTALSEAQQCVENVRDFVSDPNRILGSGPTKHGEIAEHIQVEIGNAKRIMEHLPPNGTFEGVGRTAPEDYLIDGKQVQSKFLNNANRTIDAVLKHMKNYPGFCDRGYYHIPKDQYETIQKVLSGDTSGLSSKTIRACRQCVEQIQRETGKPFQDVVRPAISNYRDVQLGTVDKTLNAQQEEFRNQHQQEIDDIKNQKIRDEQNAASIKEGTWGKAAQAGMIAAVITGGTMAFLKVYSKIHKGKKISDFTIQDWKEVGYDFGEGSAKGGVSGIAIYWLTQKNVFSAPFAGAIVSGAIGTATLYYKYKKGELSESEFSESVCALSVESGLAAVGAAVGQAVIPIPILGAVVGTAVSKAALEIAKYVMGDKEKKLIQKMQEEFDSAVSLMEQEAQNKIKAIVSYFDKLGGFITAAMSPNVEARLYGSVQLCRFLNVPEEEIIHDTIELDDFMLN